jgi:hypothetical protein
MIYEIKLPSKIEKRIVSILKFCSVLILIFQEQLVDPF